MPRQGTKIAKKNETLPVHTTIYSSDCILNVLQNNIFQCLGFVLIGNIYRCCRPLNHRVCRADRGTQTIAIANIASFEGGIEW